GDGKADLAGREAATGRWWVGLSNGAAFQTAFWGAWSSGFTWDVKVGDFNGDGLTDLAGRIKENGQWYVNVATGAAYVTGVWAAWSAGSPGLLDWVDVQVGDFNGDGKADVTARILETGEWWTSLSLGATASLPAARWAVWAASPAVTWVDVRKAA